VDKITLQFFATLFLTAFAWSTAFAQDFPCFPHKPNNYGFEDLIIKTRVYGAVDRRGELSKLGKTLKLGGIKFSNEELKQIRGAVGVLYCKATATLPPMAETAFLLGSNKEITTAAHGLVDEWGTKRDLSTCYFENFDIPPKRSDLKVGSDRNIIGDPSSSNRRDDRARIELMSPIEDARPFAPDFSEKKLAKGTSVVLLAAQHRDLRTSGVDPVLSPCTVQDYFDWGDGVSRMKTDCDSDKGSSGGPYIFRGEDGKIYVKAMQIGMEAPDHSKIPNHTPYNNETNHTGGLVIDQTFLKWYSK
jgi:hypothetical protein